MTSIESTFLEAVKRGPVLILDNMRDKTHAGTFDPIVEKSPLIRLAILAVDLGAEPGMLSFNYSRPENVARPDYQRCFYAVLYALQPDGAEMARMLKLNLPTLGFHWCELNSMWFVDEFAAYGRRMKASRPSADNPNVRESLVALEPMAASVDLANPKHVRVLELVKEHFEAQGWVTAAERLAKCMEPQPAVESAAPVAASEPDPSTRTFTIKIDHTDVDGNPVPLSKQTAVRMAIQALAREAPEAAPAPPASTLTFVTTRMDLRDTNPDAIVAGFNKAIGPKPGSTLTEATITWTKLAVLNNDHVELQRIRDLVYERQLRLQVESDDPVSTLDVIRGLIDDAMVPPTDARDMEALRKRLEAAERQAVAEAAHAEQSSASLRTALAERDATIEKVRVLEAQVAAEREQAEKSAAGLRAPQQRVSDALSRLLVAKRVLGEPGVTDVKLAELDDLIDTAIERLTPG